MRNLVVDDPARAVSEALGNLARLPRVVQNRLVSRRLIASTIRNAQYRTYAPTSASACLAPGAARRLGRFILPWREPISSPIERLSRFQLEKLYLGTALQSPGGERLLAFHQVYAAPDRVAFQREALDMESEQLAQYWVNRRIRGEGGAPRVVGSVELLHQVAGRLAQSVGYVRVDQVGPELRVIPIDGLLPGEPGYLVALEDDAEAFG